MNELKAKAAEKARAINEARNMPVPESQRFDIFLAHSFHDKEAVLGLYMALTEQGFSEVVDLVRTGLDQMYVIVVDVF